MQQSIHQWTDYNRSSAQCKEWLCRAEKTVEDLDLKSSVTEKQQQLQAIEVDCLICHTVKCKITIAY